MPRTITITITVDDDAEVRVTQSAPPPADESPTARYFARYLSSNGRRVYRAAARLDLASEEPYSFEAIAQELGESYESVQSMHRSTGRTRKKWERETGQPVPFELDWKAYLETPAGRRTVYRLPEGVADEINGLVAEAGAGQ